MGVVYRATDLALDRQVAVKLIAPALADDPAFRRRFVSESKVAASRDHPNVIPIHHAGEQDGVLFQPRRCRRTRSAPGRPRRRWSAGCCRRAISDV